MALFDCAINEKCCSIDGGQLRTGHLPSFFVPTTGNLTTQKSPPGNLPSKAKKMPLPGGQPELLFITRRVVKVASRKTPRLFACLFNAREGTSYKRLMEMCRWMGSHFHDWIDYRTRLDSRVLLNRVKH